MVHDTVEVVPKEMIPGIPSDILLPMREVKTDKNEATRGTKSYSEHPMQARTRFVSPGYADKQALEKPLDTDAPTLSSEAT